MVYEYHIPIESRSYRIEKRGGMINYLQRCYPHNQHRILGFLCYRGFRDNIDIFTQKVLQEELELNKGTISKTLKKMVERGHIEIVSKKRPYWYRMTPPGDQYSRYIFSRFPFYRLDLFNYFYEMPSVDFDNLISINDSLHALKEVEGQNDHEINCAEIHTRLLFLPMELQMEFTRLFVRFTDMSYKERMEMLRCRDWRELKKIYQLLEEEFQIRYRLTNYLKIRKQLLDMENESWEH